MAKKMKDAMLKMKPMVHLSSEDMKTHGFHKGPLPKVGEKFPLNAEAHVSSVGENDDGRHMAMELHNLDLGVKKKMDDGEMAKGMKGAVDKAVSARDESED